MRHELALLLVLLVIGSTGAAATASKQQLSVETIEADTSGPSVDRVDNETWQVPKEATAVYVSGTTARDDGTVVILYVVRDGDTVRTGDDETIRVGETEAADGRWNATVDLSDLLTGTHTLRVTDGEETATAQVELVHVLRPPSVTPTKTTVATLPAPTLLSDDNETRSHAATRRRTERVSSRRSSGK